MRVPDEARVVPTAPQSPSGCREIVSIECEGGRLCAYLANEMLTASKETIKSSVP